MLSLIFTCLLSVSMITLEAPAATFVSATPVTIATPADLIGSWQLDMSPQNPNDNNFAMMRIKKADASGFKGTFYREGVKIRNGQLNTQTDRIYGALISGDNSGEYHTSFYLEGGKLYGSTHAIDRDFLSVWVATRVEE